MAQATTEGSRVGVVGIFKVDPLRGRARCPAFKSTASCKTKLARRAQKSASSILERQAGPSPCSRWRAAVSRRAVAKEAAVQNSRTAVRAAVFISGAGLLEACAWQVSDSRQSVGMAAQAFARSSGMRAVSEGADCCWMLERGWRF